MFTIAHISDLHFSSGSSRENTAHTHSIPFLLAAQRALAAVAPDYTIVSGDLSNNGDTESLLRANDWLFREFSIGGGDTTGLKLKPRSTGIVPGNHDAWNSGRSGKYHVRYQRSIENYNSSFVDHQIPDEKCYYDWLERGDCRVFIAFVDTSFLGDTEPYEGGADPLSRIARGKLSVSQAHQLLQWHDQGLNGNLPVPYDPGRMICGDAFASSLKVLVMHHYLFPPRGHEGDYFMDLNFVDNVVRNIILADYDVVLCGHKHVADLDMRTVSDLLDSRARRRYLLNCLRRSVGLYAQPVRVADSEGRRVSKVIAQLVAVFVATRRPEDSTDEFIESLVGLVENPAGNRQRVAALLALPPRWRSEDEIKGEVEDILRHIQVTMNADRRKILTDRLRPYLRSAIRAIGKRPLVQVMCGSTAKARRQEATQRSFNVYLVERFDRGYRFKVERHSLINDRDGFAATSQHSIEFMDDRRCVDPGRVITLASPGESV